MLYGVTPVLYNIPRFRKIPYAAKHLLSLGLVKPTDLALFTAGMYSKKLHTTNVLQIHKIGELAEYTKN